MGNYKPFPFKIPFTRPVTIPFKRPFDVANDCVLCLIPEIRTKWFDQSINGLNGVLTGCTKVEGRFGMGLSFNGTSNSVQTADSAVFDVGETLTVMAWFKTSATSIDNVGIVCHDTSDYKYMLYITNNGTRLRFFVRTASGVVYATKEGDYANNKWHHYCGVYDKNLATARVKMYVDGVLENSVDGVDESIAAGDEGLTIGHLGTHYFDGIIDEVEVSNRAYTAKEIAMIYDVGKPE